MELGESFVTFAEMTGIPGRNLFEIFNDLQDYICVHSVELDDFGDVRDARLRAWNRSYERVRTKPVSIGQSMIETYFDPQIALDFVNRAWNEGSARQVFELTPATRDRYRPEGAVVVINVLWQRVGDLVVEVGNDLSEVRTLQMQLASEESAATLAIQARIVAEERARIARDLHDSVLQQLFASALQLDAIANTSLDCQFRDSVRLVTNTLTDVIAEIRAGIVEIRSELPSSLETELREAVRLIANASGVRCTVVVADDTDCGGAIRTNLRVVVRELVTNAVKHSQAVNVTATVRTEGHHLVLAVSDDGNGLPAETVRSSGLGNLRQRAEQLGGSMVLDTIRSGSNTGTVVTWQVPLPSGRKT